MTETNFELLRHTQCPPPTPSPTHAHIIKVCSSFLPLAEIFEVRVHCLGSPLDFHPNVPAPSCSEILQTSGMDWRKAYKEQALSSSGHIFIHVCDLAYENTSLKFLVDQHVQDSLQVFLASIEALEIKVPFNFSFIVCSSSSLPLDEILDVFGLRSPNPEPLGLGLHPNVPVMP